MQVNTGSGHNSFYNMFTFWSYPNYNSFFQKKQWAVCWGVVWKRLNGLLMVAWTYFWERQHDRDSDVCCGRSIVVVIFVLMFRSVWDLCETWKDVLCFVLLCEICNCPKVNLCFNTLSFNRIMKIGQIMYQSHWLYRTKQWKRLILTNWLIFHITKTS